jgi:hypothetical protein
MRCFAAEQPVVAAKVIPELDDLITHSETDIQHAVQKQGLDIGYVYPPGMGMSYKGFLELVRNELSTYLSDDPPTRFDYLPIIKPIQDISLFGLRVLLESVNGIRDPHINHKVLERLQDATINQIENSAELEWQISSLLEVPNDSDLAARMRELRPQCELEKLGVAYRDWLVLARDVVRDIGSPPAWLR